MDIAGIAWEKRAFLSKGAYGVIYEVAHSVVAKVGHVSPEEAEMQRFLAHYELALPVLGYEAAAVLPLEVRREVETRIGRPQEDGGFGVLLMPRATPIIPNHLHIVSGLQLDVKLRADSNISKFCEQVQTTCRNKFGVEWDIRMNNLACYRGRLVALDFGVPKNGIE